MTVRTVQNIVRVPLMVSAGGYAIGWRETYTYDDATASADTVDMIRRHVTAGRLALVDGAPITPDPTPEPEPNPGTGTPTPTPTAGVLSLNGKTGDLTLAKADVGLGNVNNTSDANKPVSNATKAALDGKAPLSHTHPITSITNLAGTLDTKLDASRLILPVTNPVRPVLTVNGTSPNDLGDVAVIASAGSLTPGAPTSLEYVLTEDGVRLDWTPPTSIGGSPITGYKVGRFGYDTTGVGPYVTELLNANDRSYTLLNLIPGTLYEGVWVAAANDFGLGPKRIVDVYALDAGPKGNIFPADVYDAGADVTKLSMDGVGLTVASSTLWKTAGESSAEVTITSGATDGTGLRTTSNFDVIVGNTYKFTADVQNLSVTTKFRMTIKWRRADNSSLLVQTATAVTIPTGTTQKLELTGTAPSGASYAYFIIRPSDAGQNPIPGQKFRTDSWALLDVTTPPVVDPGTGPVTSPTGNLLAAGAYDAGADLTKFSTRGSSGGTTLTASTDWAYVGTSSIKVAFTSGASRGSGPVVADYIPVTDGIYYKASARVRNGNGSQKFQMALTWFDADKKSIPGSPEGNPTTIAVDTDVTLTTQVTAPPRAAFCQVSVKNNTDTRPPTDAFYYVDAFQLEQTSTTPKADTYQWVIADKKPAGRMFTSPTSHWIVDVRNAPLHPNSAAMINTLVTKDILPNYSGIAVFNTSQYNSTNYTVSKDHPRINIGFCDAQRKGYTPGELYSTAGVYKTFMNVPVPRGAVNGGGGDGHITIHCPETDQVWEYWQFQEDRQQDSGYGGVQPAAAAAGDFGYKTAAQIGKDWRGFSATWGGRIDNVSQNPGKFPASTGTSATGLSYADGTVSFADLETARTTGIFTHALAISIVSPRQNVFSWPASRTDGYVNSSNNLPEGLRLRMDPSINFDTFSGLHWIARAIGRTLQLYGGIITDKSGGVEVEGESSAAILRRGGSNPWPSYLGTTPDYNVMKNFPWASMQALPMDYLKP